MPKRKGIVKKRNKWYYYIYKDGKQYWSKGYDTAIEASIEREKKKKELQNVRSLTYYNITFKDFIIKYLKEYVKPFLKKATFIQIESHARLYIVPDLGSIKLRDLQKSHFYDLNTKLVQEKTISVAYHVMRTCKKILNKAVEWEYISYNPVPRELAKEPRRKTHSILTLEQINNLIDNLEGRDKYIIAIAGYTGLRRGEIFGLQWKDINFQNKTITIKRQYTSGEVTELKTEASKAAIPMLYQLPELLKEWRSISKSFTWLFPGKTPDKPMAHERWIGKNWQQIKRDHNLPKDFRFHDFRHSIATILIEKGIAIPYVQLLLRHSSYQITADKYGHYQIENIREILEKAFG